MQHSLQPPTATTTTTLPDDIDSACSTPFVSAPSSPSDQGQPPGGYYYSAPASPMHFILSTTNFTTCNTSKKHEPSSFEFDFSAKLTADGASSPGSTAMMSSADELFFNGQIRPMRLSTHLQRPQMLSPLLNIEENDEDYDGKCTSRGRDLKLRDKSMRRRTRSLSPFRTPSFENDEIIVPQNETIDDDSKNENKEEVIASDTTSSSRSSSVGRSSKRWVFLKEFLYRSKSEGRNNGNKILNKKMEKMENLKIPKKTCRDNPMMRKRRVPPSAHELHYTANRAQAEEMRKRTFLPYKQGLLGCLGFSSKSYGAWNGFTKALNPVSSR